MPQDEHLPEVFQQAINDAIRTESPLEAFGFQQDSMGQWFVQGECRVTLYRVGGDWELDIHLPNGSVIGGDIPLATFGGKTASELQAERAAHDQEADDLTF